MCGIVGVISDKKVIFQPEFLEAISHRGPDSQDYYCQDNILLGHTRLSIQDISANGNQPMFSSDGRYVIIFNGEIYNHQDIRNEYLSDVFFKSTGDTETVLYAYIKLGENFFSLLNGIFSFAIFDRSTEDLIIARDHFGVKPLYIYQDENKLIFSSELKSFLNFDIKKEIDYKGIFNYLTFLWSPGERTAFAKVKKLLPGHYMKCKIDNFNQVKEVEFGSNDFSGIYSKKSEKELIDELDDLLNKAVRRQMLSDVPIGFFLSGGLDSTLLVAIAKKQNPDLNIQCFTIDVVDWSNRQENFANDLDYAVLASQYLGVKLHIVKADINIIKDFDRMVWHLDEPQADAAPLNVLKIAELARQNNIKVLIGGTGGDDIFSGYRRHQALKGEVLINKIPLVLRKIIKLLGALIPGNYVHIRRIKKVIKNLNKDQLARMKGYFQWLSTKEVYSLFSQEIKRKIDNYDPTDFFDKLSQKNQLETDLLNKMLYWELNTFLVDHNLNYTDKMGMAVGVEIRVPFLDRDLVKFSQSLPPHLKLKHNETKYILKKVAERYLPNEIIYRPKTGFGAPVRQWITNELHPMIEERLSPEHLEQRKIFDSNKVWKLINENKAGKIDASYSIWALLAIESWLQQFGDNKIKINSD